MEDFEIEFLDHVAIRVADMEQSILWYTKVLGLKKYIVPEWGEYPVFLLAGKTGLAIFPANQEDEKININSKNVRIDHFAFNLTSDNFNKAIKKYEALNISYTFQDHIHFHSIYTRDPDGHTVELTTLVTDPISFYMNS